MLNKNSSLGVGSTSPQMGSLCLTALEHGAVVKHPGMGLKLELTRAAACGALTIVNHGSRRQGQRKGKHVFLGV